jgi:hypothetical protein
MTIAISGTTGITLAGQFDSASTFGFKNRIINGAMVIDQRNAGAEVNPAVNSTYYLDRWQATSGAASKFKIGQNAGAVTPPTGYKNYLGITSLSAYTVGASEGFTIRQSLEGLNVADFAWGTASAATVTLSFWVRSSLTGTFGGSLRNSAPDRSYPFTYSISSANTWEQKTITVAGDTTGTWLTTNGIGLTVIFGLGVGSTFSGTANVWQSGNYLAPTGAVSVVGTNGATFYITGVQLEKGSTATSFDYRPYTTELQLCQRYFEKSYDIGTALGASTSSGAAFGGGLNAGAPASSPMATVVYKVTKRSSATISLYDVVGNLGKATTWTSGVSTNNVTASAWQAGETGFLTYINSPITAGIIFQWVINAEL